MKLHDDGCQLEGNVSACRRPLQKLPKGMYTVG